jgi:hypothetical protein
MNSTVLIISMARCGSSGFFELLKNNLGHKCIGFFEPNEIEFSESDLEDLQTENPVVVKYLLRPYLSINRDFSQIFTKTIGLIRDPRDNLLSRLLFRMVSPRFIQNPQIYSEIIPLLEKKLATPHSVSMIDLFRSIEATNLMEKMIDHRFQENLELYMQWHDSSKSAFIFPYEDFIANDFSSLGNYLGFSVKSNNSLKVVFPAIKRSGGMGEWRQWFTAEDIDFFRPRMSSFMKRYGYADDWELPKVPVIDPTTSIDYVKQHAGLAGLVV